MKQIAQGAEAKIYLSDGKIVKERISKSYRIKEIDQKLRKERTKVEARLLQKLARVGVNVPRILKVDEIKTTLEIEEIKGDKVRDYLLKSKDTKIFGQIAKQVELMHAAGIVHGDLTTSNMILSKNRIFLIDFGLSGHSDRVEDKAVDLHLLKECLKSKHFEIWEQAWKVFEKNYGIKEVLNRLKVVERRGRYKEKAPI